MVDTVKNVFNVLASMRDALTRDTRTSSMTVRMMAPVNKNAGSAASGWVGLYADTIAYTPRTAGAGVQNWNFEPVFRVIVQASDTADTENAFRKTSEHLKSVLDVILANKDLATHVEMLHAIDVDFAIREEDTRTLHFVGALATLRYTGRTN